MALEIHLETTGTLNPVVIEDFGNRSFAHPSDVNLLDEFDEEEIRNSPGILIALLAGHITLKNGLGVEFSDIFHVVGHEHDLSDNGGGNGGGSVVGMVVLTNTNGEAGTWANETEAAASVSGSTFDGLPGLAAENSFYVGGEAPFSGIKTKILVTAMDLGAGAVVWEYWNGVSWISFHIMATDSEAPYDQYAEAALVRVATDRIRFGEMDSWTSRTLDGETKYWLRMRVTTAITTAPILEQTTFHGDEIRINSDGVTEFFGAAEPHRVAQIHRRLLDAVQGSAPTDTNLEFSSGVVLVAHDNQFNNGVLDAIGFAGELGAGVDTSKPVTLTIGWYKTTAGDGDIEWEIIKVVAKIGDILDGTLPEVTFSEITTAPVGAGGIEELTKTVLEIDVEEMLPLEIIATRIFRDATAGNGDDTLASDAVLVYVQAVATFWR